ncbi:hypothetical protein M422DRAFT_253887 [Sphaerobolus stellatus SS14]|uniref:Uncharacterized protein n=1 Tax=Sphaerobolus stellatus (strain SS14) TaxID=990650 RepID=A0A0C9VVS2_SPHS4|nr:hypothetical protein M422DRAFT_253887 [Sphaerobolus stellatus SS14]
MTFTLTQTTEGSSTIELGQCEAPAPRVEDQPDPSPALIVKGPALQPHTTVRGGGLSIGKQVADCLQAHNPSASTQLLVQPSAPGQAAKPHNLNRQSDDKDQT